MHNKEGQFIASGASDEQKNTSKNILIELQSEIAIRKMADVQKENTQNDSIASAAD